MAWPLVCIAYSPLLPESQPLLVQLVGLREAVLVVPCLLLGARLDRLDLERIAPALGVLNVVALAFALLEYVFGVETFIPRSAVTELIYQSKDVQSAGATFYRIPSIFINSHAYGGTMVMSVPFLIQGLDLGGRRRTLCWAGLLAATAGAFMCGARLPVVMLLAATAYAVLSGRIRVGTLVTFAVVGAAMTYLILHAERLQRFTTLGDSDLVRHRLGTSMNLSFFDILLAYPVGAGLASAFGTSIPYFLANDPGIHSQIGMETEYSRLVLEEGIIGLLLWLALALISSLRAGQTRAMSPAAGSYLRALIGITWLVGLLGAGLLSAVPSAALLLTAMGLRIAEPDALGRSPKSRTSRPILRDRLARPPRASPDAATVTPTLANSRP